MSYDDVLARINSKLVSTRPEGLSREAWQELRAIVADLAGGEDDDSAENASWRVSRVKVSGFRGASADDGPVELAIEPAPGLTVVHGANGSGKSTIASAIRAALDPDYTVRTQGPRPKVDDDPWTGFDVNAGAEQAEIEVTLTSGDEPAITVTATVHGDGRLTRQVRRRKASGMSEELPGWWAPAFQLHRPIFAYADEYRQIKEVRDLRSYLVSHFSIGGALISVKRRVDSELNAARRAHRQIEAAWEGLEAELDRVSETYPAAPQVVINQPEVGQSADEWLTAVGLTGTASEERVPHVAHEQIEEFKRAVIAADGAISDYRDAAASVTWGEIKGVLDQLSKKAAALPDERCPVCDTEVDWKAHLAHRRRELAGLKEADAATGRAIKALLERLDVATVVRALLALQDADRPHAKWASEVEAALVRSDTITRTAHHEAAATKVVTNLREIVEDDRFDAVARRLLEHADALQAWHRLRCLAAQRFADVHRKQMEVARGRSLWETVSEHRKQLEGEFERERAEAFLSSADEACRRLLGDAGLALHELKLQARVAEPTFVTGDGGQQLPLGALSSGQHNAFLLAPVVGERSAEPFGFVVFDDPVHALDGIRIDALARHLRERAKTHQVVVFTHDDRLTEYLRNATHNSTFWRMTRTGSMISVTRDRPLWKLLIKTCSALPGAESPGGAVEVDEVRSLLRQAIDAAIRDSLLVHLGQADTHDMAESLRKLDRSPNTKGRFRHLQIEYPGTELAERAARAYGLVEPHLSAWSDATHRAAPTPWRDVEAEISCAEAACKAMVDGGAA